MQYNHITLWLKIKNASDTDAAIDGTLMYDLEPDSETMDEESSGEGECSEMEDMNKKNPLTGVKV